MHESFEFLRNLALVLGVAAVATIVFQRMRLPVVFGYLLAGLVLGPHIPIRLVADETIVQTLAELGVIMLMFSLGLEFSLRKLVVVAPTAGIIALAQSSFMMLIGFAIGQIFGWTRLESVFAGAIIAIASTTIIVKAFAENNVRGKVTELVFGILIIEDLIAIFLLVLLTAFSSTGGITTATLGVTALKLVMFLAGLLGFGLLIVPRLMRLVVSLDRPETSLVASIGICFTAALIARTFGYSVALGAFVAGSLIAESGVASKVEHLVHPVRDMFGAVFFVSVGMMIDPGAVANNWLAVLVLTVAVIVGNLLIVSVSAFLIGVDTRTAIKAGMSLGQIGEFSFIIAGLGLAAGATRSFLYPVAIAVSAITTLTTPLMIRSAERVASFLDAKLPRSMQTFVPLYGSWIERMRTSPGEAKRSRTRRLVRLLLLDVAALAILIVGTSLELSLLTSLIERVFGLSGTTARYSVFALAALAGIPLVFGFVTTARRLGFLLAQRALPQVAKGKVDFAAAPRRSLITALQLAIVLVTGIPLVAITAPFIPQLRGVAVLAGVILLFGVAFWRSATNLHGHARAGAEVIAAVLAKQMADTTEMQIHDASRRLDAALPGLGHPIIVPLRETSPAVGMSLSELNLRGITGATILAITRENEQILVPRGRDVLRRGDIVALAGTHESIEHAKSILHPG
jgi:CPA2 family monovalent cation:H+ antiporter-2